MEQEERDIFQPSVTAALPLYSQRWHRDKTMKEKPADSPLEVLIIGRHRDTMDRTLKTLSLLPIRIDGAITDDQAFDFLSRHRYDGT